ncbi:MAG: type II secretion system protein [Phycisphaerales bacterium]|nr:type II secretion system protein [Phycisphaerales bacterium]
MKGRRHHPHLIARREHRRGMTLIEVILAVVLLGMVGATLASAAGFMGSMQRRLEQNLGAAELANRLMLQFIDDRESLPSQALPIEYDRDRFRWTLEERPVTFNVESNADAQTSSSTAVGSGASLSRIKMVTIRVWLGADSGGSRAFEQGIPNATITRLIDPLAFSNPDSLETLLNQPGGIERLLQQFIDSQGGG